MIYPANKVQQLVQEFDWNPLTSTALQAADLQRLFRC